MAPATQLPLKVGINGCCEIGRMFACVALQRDNVELVAINERSLTIVDISKKLKNDLNCSGMRVEVVVKDNKTLLLGGKPVAIFACSEPGEIPWGKVGAEYIVEATGKCIRKDEAAAHLQGSGVKKVVICASSEDAPSFVIGVNEKSYTSDLDVVSAATPTTNSVALLAKFIDDNFGIAEGVITRYHSPTPVTQTAVGESMLRSMNEDREALARVDSRLARKFAWMADKPLTAPNVSMVELIVTLENQVIYDDIKRVVREQSEGRLNRILGYADAMEEIDVVHNNRSCVFIAEAGFKVLDNGKLAEFVCVQDENWAYCHRVVDLMKHMSNA